MSNPYSELAQHIKRFGNNNAGTLEIGEIISLSPMRVRLDKPNNQQLVLEEDDLMINYNITKPEETLRIGDKVAIMPTGNKQLYVILAKVVRCG